MPLPLPQSGGPILGPTPLQPGNSAGSPYNSGMGMVMGGNLGSFQQNPTGNPFPFYNNDTTGGAPSPLTNQQQQQYLTQGNGLTNALGGNDGSSNPGADSYNSLLQQLAQIGGGGQSQASLESLAQQEAGLKYDPLIAQLQQNLGTAQTNSQNASTKIGDLYGALGRGLAAQLPGITNQFNQQEDAAKQNYSTLQQQIASNYQGAQAAQAAELQKLGIQAALPQSTQKLNADQQYLQNQAGVNGQALQNAIGEMGQGQADFFQRASAVAPMQGANLQSNLAQQLLQLQNSTNQQIAGYRGQEGAQAATLLQQLMAQNTSNTQKQQSDLINNTYKLDQIQKLTEPGIFGVAPKAPTAGQYKGLTGINQYFADNKTAADPSQLNADFLGFEGSKQMQTVASSGTSNFETALPALEQYIQQNDPGLSQAGVSELINALAIRYGKF